VASQPAPTICSTMTMFPGSNGIAEKICAQTRSGLQEINISGAERWKLHEDIYSDDFQPLTIK
jgi:hypothetical protein